VGRTGFTDRTVLANLPVIVLHYKEEETCLLIDIDIPCDSNFNTHKKLKNHTITKTWRSRSAGVESEEKKIVPVVVGALGTIKKGLDQNLQLPPRQPSAIELQKITLMSIAHVIFKVLGKITVISC
jgi:hypothetical protein